MNKEEIEVLNKQGTNIRYNEMIKLVGKNKTVLNIGDTNSSQLTKKLRLNNKVKTVDYTKDSDKQWNLEKGLPNFKKKFDCIVAGEIFEHIYHLKKLLLDILTCLKINGSLVLSVPNVCNLRSRIRVMLGLLPTYAADADEFEERYGYPGHIRDFNLKEIKRILINAGFKPVKYSSTGLFFRFKQIIPIALCPVSLSDNIIISAKVKRK